MTFIRLDFLTSDSRMRDLCTKYWALDSIPNFVYKVAELSQQFNIKYTAVGAVVAENCRAYSQEIVCDRCGTERIFSNRTDFQHAVRSKDFSWTCSSCQSEIMKQKVARERTEEERFRHIIRTTYSLGAHRWPVEPRNLSFESAVYLLSLIRAGASEDFSLIWPVWTFRQPLAPTGKLQREIIDKLDDESLIMVHPDSPSEAFVFEGDHIKAYYLYKVKWALPIGEKTDNPRDLVHDLEVLFRTMDWPEDWSDQQVSLWRKIALHECLEYLDISLKEHGFSLNPGDKTYQVFRNLLEDHSVAQAYNVIWRAAKDAAAFYLRERVSKQHAANTVVGSIQRQLDRARAEGWEIKRYRRDRRCPQSVVSQVLYDAVLQIGEEGFTRPPG